MRHENIIFDNSMFCHVEECLTSIFVYHTSISNQKVKNDYKHTKITLATRKMATFGKLSEFDASKEDWQSYVESLDFFFEANNIENWSQKRAILLSSCGAPFYKLFRGLVQPANKVTN